MFENQILAVRPHRLRRQTAQKVGIVPLILLLAAVPAALARADESPVTATAGYEYYTGPDNQLTRTATAEVEGKIQEVRASLSGGRFNDQGVGAGWNLGAGLGLPLAPRRRLELDAEGAFGDTGYVAWTFKLGPAFDLTRGQTLTVEYVRVQDNENSVANGLSAELEGPLIPDHLSASGSLSYNKIDDLGGLEGTAGLSWTPIDHLELEGDAGYTSTGLSLHSPFSPKHVSQSSRSGHGRPVSTTTATGLQETPGMTALVAVRVSFP